MNLRRCKHVYEMRPRKDKRGVDLISGVLPFGQQCNRLRKVPQPLTSCRDPRLR